MSKSEIARKSEVVEDGSWKLDDSTVEYQVAELKIPVPWGHIAAKAWNKPSGIPVLAVHGSMDNSGTFNRLIPLLPTSHYYVCIDLPSHGLSSYFPSGLLLEFFDFVMSLRLVADHFAWEKFVLMGHSFGGQLCAVFTALYPWRIQRLVLLDALSPYALSIDGFRQYYEHCVNMLLKLNGDRKLPSHTYEEALQRMVSKRVDKITVEAAKHLLERGLIKSPDGRHIFSVDPRMKIFMPFGFGSKQSGTSLLRPINCPQLTFITDYGRKRIATREELRSTMEAFTQRSNFTCVEVEGSHDIHNISPEKVSGDISEFLTKQTSML